MKKSIFVTGTDTDVGKTFVTSLLMLAANHYFSTAYFKPIQTGDELDTEFVKTLTQLPPENFYNPYYHFAEPASPNRAAKAEGKEIEIQKIIQMWQQLPSGNYVLEGAGGLMVPLAKKILVRDLIQHLNLPALIVARTRLGTINHTLLTIEAAKNKGLNVKGVVLNGHPDPGLGEVLQEHDIRILAEVPYVDTLTHAHLKKLAIELFTPSLLQEIFTPHG